MRRYNVWILNVFFASLTVFVGQASAQQRTLCVHGINAPDRLSVRSAPQSNGRVIAQFPAKTCGIRLAGRCEGAWCEMARGRTFGWVDTQYIGVYELPGSSAGSGRVARADRPAVEQPEQRTIPRFERRADRRPVRRSDRSRNVEQEQGSRDATACVARVDRDDTLRIRTGPGVGHEEIGEIPPRACGVAIGDACRGRWCRIAWRGRTGWVNTYYLN